MYCEIKNLTKARGNNIIFQDVNISFAGVGIYGILGGKGSGKTTFLELLLGTIDPDKGVVSWDMKTNDSKNWHFGVVFDSINFVSYKTGFANLVDLSDIKKIIFEEDIRFTMRKLRLPVSKNLKTGNYSPDMLKRLTIAQAIMENQPVLLIDEPFKHIEPVNKDFIKNVIYNCMCEGRMIILTSTAYDEYIHSLCTSIYEIRDKKIYNRINS